MELGEVALDVSLLPLLAPALAAGAGAGSGAAALALRAGRTGLGSSAGELCCSEVRLAGTGAAAVDVVVAAGEGTTAFGVVTAVAVVVAVALAPAESLALFSCFIRSISSSSLGWGLEVGAAAGLGAAGLGAGGGVAFFGLASSISLSFTQNIVTKYCQALAPNF